MVRGAMRVGVGECSPRPYLGLASAATALTSLVLCACVTAAVSDAAGAGGRSLSAAAGAGYRFMRVHLDSASLYRCALTHPQGGCIDARNTHTPPPCFFSFLSSVHTRCTHVSFFSPRLNASSNRTISSSSSAAASLHLPPRRVPPSRGKWYMSSQRLSRLPTRSSSCFFSLPPSLSLSHDDDVSRHIFHNFF